MVESGIGLGLGASKSFTKHAHLWLPAGRGFVRIGCRQAIQDVHLFIALEENISISSTTQQ